MDQQLVIQGAVTVAVGAISGGITNAVAIWMLFHPYEPRGVGRLKIQGAIPKNKDRLARSIGKTVGERLLTPEDLSERLGAPSVRAAFTDAIGGALGTLLEQERGPLREQLSPEVVRALDEAVAGLAPKVAARVPTWADSDDLARMMRGFIDRIASEIGERPIGGALAGGHRELIAGKVQGWVEGLAEGDELEATLRRFVSTQLAKLESDDRPLLDRLPHGLIGTVEHAITDYLPIALERLSALLSDPEAREKDRKSTRLNSSHLVIAD